MISAALGLLVLLAIPFAARLGASSTIDADLRLIVLTPHVQQIREEFARGFSAWHEREYGEPVLVDYRTPGGTSEIRRQLEAEFRAQIAQGRYAVVEGPSGPRLVLPVGAIGVDLLFGGGSYEHGQLARGVRATVAGDDGAAVEMSVPISDPAGLTEEELATIFGENRIGTQQLYSDDQRWIGTALSGFGLVYNRDALEQLGVPPPESFGDLTDPRLRGWLALADPRQSGSITTTFDSILGKQGWDEGWRILREMCGNARYFSQKSTAPPADVSSGDAAAGLAIDFYGRGQAQSVADAGDPGRMSYVDPAGEVYIDADPVSIMHGGPNPELARRFLRFVLSEEGQALWQFPVVGSADGEDNPLGPDGEPMGPRVHELRRLPVRRSMYADHFEHFRDRVRPFEIASDVENPGWRTGVQMMMGAFGIDTARQCRAAWDAIAEASADETFPAEVLAEMRRRFHVFPLTPVVDESGVERGVPFTEATYGEVRNQWRDPVRESRLRIAYTRFFRERYEEVAAMGRSRSMIPVRDGPLSAVGAGAAEGAEKR